MHGGVELGESVFEKVWVYVGEREVGAVGVEDFGDGQADSSHAGYGVDFFFDGVHWFCLWW